MTKFKTTLGASISVLMLCTSNAAIAGDTKFGVLFGSAASNDSSESVITPISLGGTPATFGYAVNSSSKTGYLFGGSVSYWADSGFIYEAELSYRRNRSSINGEISFADGTQSDSLPTSGAATTDALSALANVWYEFGVNTDRSFRPYLGGGAGVSRVEVDGQFSSSGTALGFNIDNTTNISTSNTQFAWHLGAGVNYHRINDTVLSLGYRYMDLGSNGSGLSNGSGTHSIVAGVRF